MGMTNDIESKIFSQCTSMVPDGNGFWGKAFYFKGMSEVNDVIELLGKQKLFVCVGFNKTELNTHSSNGCFG
jgi:hypothetical protein